MPEEAGKVNAYICSSCKGRIITKNRQEGTTPFQVSCHATEGCQGTMFSQFYRVDQHLVPTHEWFTPRTAGERRRWLRDPYTADHVKQGGLLLREVMN